MVSAIFSGCSTSKQFSPEISDIVNGDHDSDGDLSLNKNVQ